MAFCHVNVVMLSVRTLYLVPVHTKIDPWSVLMGARAYLRPASIERFFVDGDAKVPAPHRNPSLSPGSEPSGWHCQSSKGEIDAKNQEQ
jgi:hypothetical protein